MTTTSGGGQEETEKEERHRMRMVRDARTRSASAPLAADIAHITCSRKFAAQHMQIVTIDLD